MDILRLRLTVLGMFMVSAIGEQKIITAESGQNVTLTGRAPNNNKPIIVVEWSRADLGNEYVLQYRDDQLDPDDQHPSFKNRVDLQDRQMKDGDVSLILKDVTINDTGTYECRVVQRRKKHRKRALQDGELISSITLSVAPPGPGGDTEDGQEEGTSVGLIVALSVAALVVVVAAVVGFRIYRKRNRGSSQPPDNKQSSEMSPVYLQVSSESPDPDSV